MVENLSLSRDKTKSQHSSKKFVTKSRTSHINLSKRKKRKLKMTQVLVRRTLEILKVLMMIQVLTTVVKVYRFKSRHKILMKNLQVKGSQKIKWLDQMLKVSKNKSNVTLVINFFLSKVKKKFRQLKSTMTLKKWIKTQKRLQATKRKRNQL